MAAFAFLVAATLATSVPRTMLGCPRHPRTSAGVLATEQEWVRAIESHDFKALSCILAPEFVDTNWRGEAIPRADVLSSLRSRPAVRMKLSDLSVYLLGRFAIVRGTNTQLTADARISGSVRFTDMFVYRGGAWRAVSAQETLITKEQQ